MNIVNEYLENKQQDYLFSLAFTALFLFLPCAGYIMSYYTESNLLLYGSIPYCAGLLLFLTIKPAYKINKAKADRYEMYFFKIAPFGIGLLCRYWPPYQRMARRLVNDEAIQGCENALNIMERDFKSGWKQFREWFPKIEVSDQTRKKRYELVKTAMHFAIKHEETSLRNSFRDRAIRTGNALLLDTVNIEKILRDEISNNAAFQDISQKAFDLELEKRSYELFRIREMLFISNTDWVFEEMCKIEN